jgi:hypothetical protein
VLVTFSLPRTFIDERRVDNGQVLRLDLLPVGSGIAVQPEPGSVQVT